MVTKKMNYDLKCGNSIELLKTIPTESVDLVVTDPPYKVISGGNWLFKFSVIQK